MLALAALVVIATGVGTLLLSRTERWFWIGFSIAVLGLVFAETL